MRELTVSEAQAYCLGRHIPFYTYRLPGQQETIFGAQLEGKVDLSGHFGAEGFVVVPFKESAQVPPLFIRGDLVCRDMIPACRLQEAMTGSPDSRLPQQSVSRSEYHRQVTAAITDLRRGRAQKMVLSRGLTVDGEGYRQAPLWFEKLIQQYPNAFVFLVSVPGIMTWMGATPEIFLQQEAGKVMTMALAGTRPAGQKGPWGEKEKEEQAIVSEYIAGILKQIGNWQSTGPFTQNAGRVEHLCTTFTSLQTLTAEEIGQLRRALHPTPAVGGFPLQESLAMIDELEGGQRRYYAGYLGPLHSAGRFHWFVNLRSMEIFPQAVRLYIGGGITALSDPHLEWTETEMKSRTLLDIIMESVGY